MSRRKSSKDRRRRRRERSRQRRDETLRRPPEGQRRVRGPVFVFWARGHDGPMLQFDFHHGFVAEVVETDDGDPVLGLPGGSTP